MTETAVTLDEDTDENEYEGYMREGDGGFASIQELFEAMRTLDKAKEKEYTSE